MNTPASLSVSVLFLILKPVQPVQPANKAFDFAGFRLMYKQNKDLEDTHTCMSYDEHDAYNYRYSLEGFEDSYDVPDFDAKVLEVVDFPRHKNISKTKTTRIGTTPKFSSICRGKYKCPSGIDNCCKGCGGDRYRLRHKATRKGQKTKKLSKRYLPVTDELAPKVCEKIADIEANVEAEIKAKKDREQSVMRIIHLYSSYVFDSDSDSYYHPGSFSDYPDYYSDYYSDIVSD